MGAGCSRPPMGNSVACSIEVKLPYPPQKTPGRRHTADVSGGNVKNPDVLPGRACAMGRPCRTSFSFAVCSGIRYAKSLVSLRTLPLNVYTDQASICISCLTDSSQLLFSC